MDHKNKITVGTKLKFGPSKEIYEIKEFFISCDTSLGAYDSFVTLDLVNKVNLNVDVKIHPYWLLLELMNNGQLYLADSQMSEDYYNKVVEPRLKEKFEPVS